MVSLVENLPKEHKVTQNASIQYNYAFALNRRNSAGDRERAIEVLEKVCMYMCSEWNTRLLVTDISLPLMHVYVDFGISREPSTRLLVLVWKNLQRQVCRFGIRKYGLSQKIDSLVSSFVYIHISFDYN